MLKTQDIDMNNNISNFWFGRIQINNIKMDLLIERIGINIMETSKVLILVCFRISSPWMHCIFILQEKEQDVGMDGGNQ